MATISWTSTALVFLFVVFSAGASPRAPAPPVYKSPYKISGIIVLPYAEIGETFVAYFDYANNRSRVDYYGGIQKTIQKASAKGLPNGANFKVVPITDKNVVNQITCFQLNGTKPGDVALTSVLPDLKGFKFTGTTKMSGDICNKFESVVTVGNKTSTYTFTSKQSDNTPLRYEMMGYDSLLGSHFDKYRVEYNTFQSPATFKDSDFEVDASLKCGNFPGPGISKEEKIQMDPIREFVHAEDGHVEEAFLKFKKAHQKQYSPEEHNTRHHIFRQNLRYIHSMNRAGHSFSVGVNHLADLSGSEMKVMRGYRHSHGKRGGKAFTMEEMRADPVPDQWDWRLKGAVTPVKDQAICGSCWSFGTTGTIEGAYFLKTGKLVRLSQSELVDCSWGYGNNACDGGEDFRAYQFIMDNGGLTTEDQYGPYLGIDSYCKRELTTPVAKLANYTTLPKGDLKALKVALFNKGPISVAIDASHKSFGFYANGVYYDKDCRSDPNGLDHAVLAVGYGVMDGQAYWLVKNSWSTYWGNDGYVLMSQKDNNCGVATDATYVEIKDN